jgi:hypothetical protein
MPVPKVALLFHAFIAGSIEIFLIGQVNNPFFKPGQKFLPVCPDNKNSFSTERDYRACCIMSNKYAYDLEAGRKML